MNTILIIAYLLVAIWWSHYYHVEILHQNASVRLKATLTVINFVFWPVGILWMRSTVWAAIQIDGLYWW